MNNRYYLIRPTYGYCNFKEEMNMKYKITPNYFSVIIALILGPALIDQFDFQNMTFEKPALSVLYFIVFVFSIGSMIKKSNNLEQ